ncbi:hypothetical protein Prudu_015698 [Prunus dulcis]|uniref:Uncharacterized protein n=1 Tax=Prunus dulcis TaxID=3755 RepID=A0A4Y1RJL3_PRUDU|nr:hypothetical protein Prudu_015698 [Prunus dulcis]
MAVVFLSQVPNKQEGVLSSPSWSCASTNYKEASRKTTNKEDKIRENPRFDSIYLEKVSM